MEKFKVGDRVRCINNYTDYWGGYENMEGTIIPEIHGSKGWLNIKIDKVEGLKGINEYDQRWKKISSPSPYASLKSRIEALNGNTTLQEFGELLLEVGHCEAGRLVIPTMLGNWFYVKDNGGTDKFVLDSFNTPCDAIPALKKCFMYLLDNHPTIKKDNKQEKIEALRKEAEELRKRIEDLENER